MVLTQQLEKGLLSNVTISPCNTHTHTHSHKVHLHLLSSVDTHFPNTLIFTYKIDQSLIRICAGNEWIHNTNIYTPCILTINISLPSHLSSVFLFMSKVVHTLLRCLPLPLQESSLFHMSCHRPIVNILWMTDIKWQGLYLPLLSSQGKLP